MNFFGKHICAVFAGLILSVSQGLAVAETAAANPAVTPAVTSNVIENLLVSQQGANTVVKLVTKTPLTSIPANFSIANPARVAFDFPETGNGLGRNAQQINEGDLRSANIVQVGSRTRVVFNLGKMAAYDAKVEDGALLIVFAGTVAELKPDAVAGSVAQSTRFAELKTMDEPQSIRDVKFRRGPGGEGLITVDLSSANVGIDIRMQGSNLVIDFAKTQLPDNLRRRLDVTDFATPVTGVNATQQGEVSRITISPTGLWEHNAYQTDTQFVVEVKPVIENPNKLVQGSRGGYQGEKLSLNFQNIDVRAVLQVIADFTNFNIITSDSVGGTLTLRLKDVPWDQALDIILQTKGLDMRKNGNVIRIAPRGELAAEEKANLESMQQITDLEPTRSESFQVNYQKAEDVQKVLSNKEQPVLSKRGSVMADLYTNRIFVTDTPSRLNEVRNLLALIDKPAKQVMVEAKIIQADEKFDQEIGVRLGLFDMKPTRVTGGNQGINMFGGRITPDVVAAGAPQTFTRTSNTNGNAYSSFTQSSTMGQVSFSLFSSGLSRILNVELQAMESDGKGKKLSNPRVVTANNVKAIIEDGTEIPYTVTTANTVTTQFKKAKLALEVTPQITPDGRVKMKLMITKDRPDFSNAVNGIPAIASSKVETDVLVENGGTVVIGGVSSTDDTETLDRIPVLGDIPYVGFLFKHRQTKRTRNELLIFITPKILDDTLSMR